MIRGNRPGGGGVVYGGDSRKIGHGQRLRVHRKPAADILSGLSGFGFLRSVLKVYRVLMDDNTKILLLHG